MDSTETPCLLAGPILRRLEPSRLSLWFAFSRACDLRLTIEYPDANAWTHTFNKNAGEGYELLQAGEHLFFGWLDVELETPLPSETRIPYAVELEVGNNWQDIAALAPHLLYGGQNTLSLEVPGTVDSLLHGSCRKPHHDSKDALVAADHLVGDLLSGTCETLQTRPSLLLMSGDQIYTDDVAGPVLHAIHQTIELLGIYSEDLSAVGAASMDESDAIHGNAEHYYQRLNVLPEEEIAKSWYQKIVKGARKPVFTSVASDNHLITLAEHLAMYLLVWSPTLWKRLGPRSLPAALPQEFRARYEQEFSLINGFCDGLPQVQRLLAHVSVAMIFDDHDVTDDWNLNLDWRDAAYGNDFSRRIIGNALVSYLICQGWGNKPENFAPLRGDLQAALREPGGSAHDELITNLLDFQGWDYTWKTSPELVVLDTRTRRWPSDESAIRPSGLLDWEAITDLQQILYGKPSVLLVSAGPIFGVKLIELIQHIFARLGKPLLVDAENWMGHSGTAETILNVFLHSKTPQNFVILSGDVHYSFVYDVELRLRDQGPDVW